MSHLNVPSGFLKGDAHMEHRGTAVVGEPPLLICMQILRQTLKTNLALMPPSGPVGVIGKILIREQGQRGGRMCYQYPEKW